MGNAGSFVASVALFCGVGFLPALHSIHFLPMLEPLFDRTLCLILEEKEGGGKMLVQPLQSKQCKQLHPQNTLKVLGMKRKLLSTCRTFLTVITNTFPYFDGRLFLASA